MKIRVNQGEIRNTLAQACCTHRSLQDRNDYTYSQHGWPLPEPSGYTHHLPPTGPPFDPWIASTTPTGIYQRVDDPLLFSDEEPFGVITDEHREWPLPSPSFFMLILFLHYNSSLWLNQESYFLHLNSFERGIQKKSSRALHGKSGFSSWLFTYCHLWYLSFYSAFVISHHLFTL